MQPLALGRMHASSVCFGDKGVLIVGKSGSGKSSLAFQLMSLNAALIADDQVNLIQRQEKIVLRRPENALNLIEVRHVGLLRADAVADAVLSLVIDLDTEETERLPDCHWVSCSDIKIPLFRNVRNASFPIAIRQYLLHGRHDPVGKL